MKNKYVNVVIGLPVEGSFTYLVPENLMLDVAIGKRVWIPFGKRKKTIGYIIDIKDKSSIPDKNLKNIKDIIDSEPIIDRELLKLTKQVSDYYYNSWGESIEAVIPAGLKKGKIKLASRDKLEKSPIDEDYKNEFNLNSAQKKAFKKIKEKIDNVEHQVFLLHGITASGKTEVYLQAIREARLRGKGCIVLVPEIALTPQTCERFTARFKDEIAIIHSRMLNSHRFKEWEKIKKGKASIVIGPRSAIFAPVRNLGLIVIDEEQEPTYKQEDIPRYHVREVAIMRAKNTNSVVILGSATPSLESYYKANKKEYVLLDLPERIKKKKLPVVQIIDMRDESAKQRKSRPIFSLALEKSLKNILEEKKQAILFLNRKGFATFIHCLKCGYSERCKRCNIALTYHSSQNKLICHYCNFNKDIIDICPECKSSNMRRYGKGTEKIVSEINKLFPQARVARMDTDVTVKRGSHQEILDRFKKHDIDILVGTQMIAKGLDFPRVTLVGVISADIGLNLPDFRAFERTFILLTQVAGRAGRGKSMGKVIIQTYNPESYAILTSKKQEYKEFYDTEIKTRKEFSFPPFSHLVNITFRGTNLTQVQEVSSKLYETFKKNKKSKNIEFLGPAPAAISKIKGKYRFNLILKSKYIDDIINLLKQELGIKRRVKGVYVKVDVDPLSIL